MHKKPKCKLYDSYETLHEKSGNPIRNASSQSIRLLIYFWVLPTSALAIPVVLMNQLVGGRVYVNSGVLEVEGRLVSWLIGCRAVNASAITFGHIILYTDSLSRRRHRAHELVHVEQAEKWGPFFLPGYVLLAILQWFRSGRGYWDHPWEVEARERAGI